MSTWRPLGPWSKILEKKECAGKRECKNYPLDFREIRQIIFEHFVDFVEKISCDLV